MQTLAALLAACAVMFCQPTPARSARRRRPPAGDHLGHLTVGGVDRTYILHVPESLPESAPVPLVLVFHGGGGHAATMPSFAHFDALADREKFLVVYPESFNKSWNDTRGLSPAR